MLKRLSALMLALAMLFTLSGCGAGKAHSGEGYASDQPMDVFAAIEAVKELQDFTFDLRVSDVDPDSAEAGELRYTVSGEWYTSTKQASAQILLSDGTVLTTLTVDGTDAYADLGTAAAVLMPRFEQQGAALYAGDMEAARKRLEEDAVHFSLREDPWTTLENRLSGSRENLKQLYEKVKRDNARRVRMEEHMGRLSLGLGDLQGTLLDITDDLTRHKSLYLGELAQVLEEDFGTLVGQSGLDAEGLLNEKWFLFEDTGEELAQLQSEGDFNGWTARILACGDEKNGYSLDFTKSFDESGNYCLSVYPAKAGKVKTPKRSVEAEDVSESAYLVFAAGKEYLKHPETVENGDESTEELTDEEVTDLFGLDEELGESVPVSTKPLEGSKALMAAVVYTGDGAERTVPLLAQYDSLRAEEGGEKPTNVIQSAEGYALEYCAINKRDLAEAALENAQIYAEDYRDIWGYDILQEPTQCAVSPSGDAAVAAMAYHDVDLEQDITVFTGCLNVENSSEMLYFDLFAYSGSITDEELQAIGELMAQLGVEQPLEIIKN